MLTETFIGKVPLACKLGQLCSLDEDRCSFDARKPFRCSKSSIILAFLALSSDKKLPFFGNFTRFRRRVEFCATVKVFRKGCSAWRWPPQPDQRYCSASRRVNSFEQSDLKTKLFCKRNSTNKEVRKKAKSRRYTSVTATDVAKLP